MSARGHHGALLAAVGPSDPYWSDVTSLLHFDGNFNDEKGIAWSNTGASIAASSPAPKFGTGCGAFPGTPSATYIQTAANAAFGFGSGDFTVEGWFYPSATSQDLCLFDTRTASNVGFAIYSGIVSGGTGFAYANNTSVLVSDGIGFSSGKWSHWAVTRSAGTIRGFIDGALRFTATDSRTISSSAPAFYGANYVFGQALKGYLDDCRITKGVSRYNANFTPPALAFPNQ